MAAAGSKANAPRDLGQAERGERNGREHFREAPQRPLDEVHRRPPELAQALEYIDLCIAYRARQQPVAAAFMEKWKK